MHRHSWSIAAAIAGGALIGTLIALEIGSMRSGAYLWGIGGIVAYVAVDFRHFVNGVVRACKHTIAWHFDLEYWKTYFIFFGGLATIFISVSIVCLATIFSMQDSHLVEFGIVMLVSETILSTLMAFAAVSRHGTSTDQQWRDSLAHFREVGWYTMKWGNPAGMAIGLVYEIAAMCPQIRAVGRAIPRGVQGFASMFREFVANVFVRVHSERRTLCFVDAAIGSAIGYTFGSVFVGTLAGAVLGVVNYELVSVRWLKLAPASR